MEHDLAFARAQAIETLPERSQRPIALPSGTIPSEPGLDGVKELLITERLCEELHGAALHRLHGHRHIGVCGDEDDRELSVCRGELALKLQTASPWQSHVEH